MSASASVAVVIPAYRVSAHILHVIAGIGDFAQFIVVVDDACPEGSGNLVHEQCTDTRVRVVRNRQNLGVGGAVLVGYRHAIDIGAQVIVKMDGDGQMDPALLPVLVGPILRGDADYTKGNRFFDLRHISRMPRSRRLGNLALSFWSKASTGYWDIFDPTNGYTAIHADVACLLPDERISQRYFFETDVLFRLNTLKAVVRDIPMDARYGDEVSNLKIGAILGEFAWKHMRNLGKRILYNYFLRDLSIASLELVAGSLLLLFALTFGGWHWYESAMTGTPASIGTVMLPTLSLLLGIQLILAFLAYDIAQVPRVPLHPRLLSRRSR